MATPAPPPPGLSPSGLKKWNAYGQYSCLTSLDFVSSGAWQDYKEGQDLGFIRDKLLDGVLDLESIDPRFLLNLCRIIQDMQDEIDNKPDRNW